MKNIKELIDWLSGLDLVQMNSLIEEHAKGLYKSYGVSMDLYFKQDIRHIEQLHAYMADYFNKKMPSLIQRGIEKTKEDDKLLTIKEAMVYLNLKSTATVYSYINRKLIKATRIGDRATRQQVRILKSELDRFLKG